MLVEDWQFQLEWNSKVKTLEIVEEIWKDVNIVYQRTYSIFFISSRDFWVWASRFYLKNKNIVLVNHSIDYPEISSDGAIRGKVNSIFIFEPLSKKSTRILNVLNVDMKGSIPRFVSNKMAEAQHESFSLLRSKIEEYHNSV